MTKPAALAVAFALSAALVGGCSRTETTSSTTTSATPPVTPSTSTSTSQSAAPPLPATPNIPTGAGNPSDATSSAPTGTTSSSATATTDNSASSSTSSSNSSAPTNTSPGSASDTAANNPTGDLTKSQEDTAMPKAGQVNNHSSTSMEESRGQTPQK